MTDWPELEAKYYIQTVKRVPLTLVRGQGARVWDDRGREYLDFVGGWAVNILGHCHPALVAALEEQARTLIQVSNQFYSVPQIELARLLVENSCLDRVFLANSGAEANEGAVKLARRYGKLKLGGAYEVITAFNSFHGRTLAMTAATGQPKYQEPYSPLPPGFVNVGYNDIGAIKAATTADTCALMLEPVQGEGGVIIPDGGFLKEVRAWCRERGLLLILDEIQTGMGRTGTLFAYQQAGIEPEIMTLAMGRGGGVPIGAFLAREEYCLFVPGEHGTTFGGNPLACAAARAVMEFVLEHDICGQAGRVGGHLLAGLEGLKGRFEIVREARGVGLLAALEFHEDVAEAVLLGCLESGLLLNRVKPNTLRFMPPLIITEQDVDRALGILEKVLAGVASPGP